MTSWQSGAGWAGSGSGTGGMQTGLATIAIPAVGLSAIVNATQANYFSPFYVNPYSTSCDGIISINGKGAPFPSYALTTPATITALKSGTSSCAIFVMGGGTFSQSYTTWGITTGVSLTGVAQ